ncbi:type IV pilus modification protein PilV [Dyella sp.]|uniref:type IV pilus modification protein PilV n=1 Tax=Dyella sp. TaxID=1869338 RepID=UPI002BFC1E64|nr:type IV pilus modification protein PilV [Dyella sp.]HTC26768.1 type IV pilus modification protein PilV [Dyella sp.]
MNKSAAYFRGFSLLEVLVALVIISIGVLGIAAMQASALSNTHSSQLESTVAIQARSLADSMVANPSYWDAGKFPPTFTVAAPAAGSTSPTITNFPAMSDDCSQNDSCDETAMAAYDVYQWGKSLNPGVTATVVCKVGAPSICSIQMNWTQKAPIAINVGSQPAAPATSGVPMVYTLVNQI